MSQTVSELLVGVLQQVGVKQIFGLIGDSARLHGHEGAWPGDHSPSLS